MKNISLNLTLDQEKTLIVNLKEQLDSFNHLLLSVEAIGVFNNHEEQVKTENMEYFSKRIQDLDELLNIIKKASTY